MHFRITSSLTAEERVRWDRFVEQAPYGHIFQSYDWGQFQKALTGREVYYFLGTSGEHWRVTALILARRYPLLPLVNYEISNGPVFAKIEDYAEALAYLDQWAAPRAVRFHVAPRWPMSYYDHFVPLYRNLKFHAIEDPYAAIYSEETALVDLRPSETDILQSFHYTTRYEIRQAEKAGVEVQMTNEAQAMEIFYPLYNEQKVFQRSLPSTRRFFGLMFQHFLRDPKNGIIALARSGDRVLSAALYYRCGKKCTYRFGASNLPLKKELDTTHLLHWRAMQYFKNLGCEWYDLCGASPSLPRDYPTWGVNLFKIGFSKHFVRSTPEFAKSYRPLFGAALQVRRRVGAAVNQWIVRFRDYCHSVRRSAPK